MKIPRIRQNPGDFVGIRRLTDVKQCASNWSLKHSLRCVMQNDECKMQNDCVAFGDYLKIFSKKIPQFCILNSAFCISRISVTN